MKKAFKRLLIACLVAMLLVAACAPAALASIAAKTNTSTRFYKSASTSSISLSLSKDAKVTVLGVNNGWAKVYTKGLTGYVPAAHLSLAERISAYVRSGAPVYRLPSSTSESFTLSVPARVYIVGVVNNYYRVQNSAGTTAYVPAGYFVSTSEVEDQIKDSIGDLLGSNNSGGSASYFDSVSEQVKLLQIVQNLLGVPYAADSNPPHSFNCSTFVKYVMAQFGIEMRGTAAEQAADSRYQMIREISALKIGDVVCFRGENSSTCDHTGIYVGDGMFVDASQNGGRVMVHSLDGWYAEHFLWARRPTK